MNRKGQQAIFVSIIGIIISVILAVVGAIMIAGSNLDAATKTLLEIVDVVGFGLIIIFLLVMAVRS